VLEFFLFETRYCIYGIHYVHMQFLRSFDYYLLELLLCACVYNFDYYLIIEFNIQFNKIYYIILVWYV
jgi:hypothetical protein